ncbi:RND family efflux transporter MFP subunit [Rhizomicrobium palustre]|uniref:RND family efflux transporter MFP subunit n=1 Tax=Rhizomicrobium palustre TaxID=189966 RepID=A0A846N139_9PROT|nr:HlyD family secretion protein [Rhizomicrobium palustre]NIK88877.1 RND family efflux transporter MFP subunit [Rhizomicrobium palustre]
MNWLRIGKGAVTTLFVIAAIVTVIGLWRFYEVYPRTPDGKVRADVVLITPDVSGLVTKVFVADNQHVKAGQVLFEIDRQRFALEVERAKAALAAKRAALQQAARVSHRNAGLSGLVAREEVEQGNAKVDALTAEVHEAEAQLSTAMLNLDRASVRASVDGKISNFSLLPGAYASAGKPVFALIALNSIHVDGYFEETKISRIHVGDPVRVRLMGESGEIKGHVVSIAGGIEDRDRVTGGNLLADVNPTFSWIRLAQRIPVRVALENPPRDMALVLGRTAAVDVLPRDR